MSFESFFGLFIAMVVVAVIPGPAVFTITTVSMTGGFNRGFYMTTGLVMADYILILLAVSGLAFVAELMGSAFIYVKYLCAVYLVWLGITLSFSKSSTSNPTIQKSHSSDILAGLLLTLSNPKAILFYVALFPAFVNVVSVTLFDLMVILLCATLAFGSVNLGYSYLASKAGAKVKTSSSFGIIQKVAGAIMASAGISVAVKA
ncbi:LysE family translocator [Pseudoalteromonas piscicida]|uniref:LysE family translocator n=1 Tax=Pseudoalteromonas piscicida TaxID=43662 RepID=UPI0005FA7CC8|nr:LysE family translocator [Pseudoalteromonas piscicida]KJZ03928.1 membrane protein [Pseudoalteromonas piscicida]